MNCTFICICNDAANKTVGNKTPLWGTCAVCYLFHQLIRFSASRAAELIILACT